MPFGQHEDRIATNFGVSLRTPGTRRIAIIKHGRPGRSQLSCFSYRQPLRSGPLYSPTPQKSKLCFSKRVISDRKRSFREACSHNTLRPKVRRGFAYVAETKEEGISPEERRAARISVAAAIANMWIYGGWCQPVLWRVGRNHGEVTV